MTGLVRLSAALVVVVALAFSPLASGSAPTASKVTIHISPAGSAKYLYGLVSSAKRACLKRSIDVVARVSQSGPYLPVAGTSGSNSDGTWTFLPDSGVVTNGYYKAIASPKNHKGVNCSQAQSKPLFVD
jgi:hypothetical protein